MQLESLTARVRPRPPWEAMDLGLMMVQKWWFKIAISWLLFTLPLFVLLHFILPSFAWVVLVLWWLKPIFDRLPLHIISRALFGEVEPLAKTLRSIPGIVLPHTIKMLTYLRFDPARSFNLPVWQLERLKGSARAERARILKKFTFGNAFSLLVMCTFFEICLFFGLIGLLWSYLPIQYTDQMSEALGNLNIFMFFYHMFDMMNNVWWAGVLINSLFYIIYFVIEPFYVGAGFGLYINRRTQLEGWDIEITFRQLAQRIKQPIRNVAVILAPWLVLMSAVFYPAQSVYAEDQVGSPAAQIANSELSNEQARQSIDEIMSAEEFNQIRTVTKYRDKEKKEKEKKSSSSWDGFGFSWFSSGLGLIGEILLWGILAILIALAIIYYLRWAPSLSHSSHKVNKNLPKSLFGLEITPESLPEDVGQAALDLWHKDPLKALSLLYRGALTTIVHHHGVSLKGSATEGDCIRIVHQHKQKLRENSAHYFKNLTRAWQFAAYAHRLPTQAEMQELALHWSDYFGAPR